MAVKRGTTRKPTGTLKRFSDAKKYESRIIGDIERHLLGTDTDAHWDKGVLHVSEMANPGWCPRQSYYRISGAKATNEEPASFRLETIWEEGSEIGRKWQGWVHALGRLRGQWQCLYCQRVWDDTSPKACTCGSEALKYLEVPLWSEEYGIAAHADGDIDEGTTDDPLMEVKSIGIGTIRKEMPALLAKYTHTVTTDSGAERKLIDLDRLWRDIKRPFPSHLKQGFLYCFLMGRTTCVFIYEFKPTQAVKEFVVRLRKEMIEDLLDLALDVKYSLAQGRPPVRPSWAKEADSTGCKSCAYRDTCWDISTTGEPDESEDQPQRQAGRRIPRRQTGAGEGGAPPSRAAEVPHPRSANTHNGDGRPRADEPVRSPHSLAGLLDRATRPGGGRREVRRRPPGEAGG